MLLLNLVGTGKGRMGKGPRNERFDCCLWISSLTLAFLGGIEREFKVLPDLIIGSEGGSIWHLDSAPEPRSTFPFLSIRKA